jgi:hypothetical protein
MKFLGIAPAVRGPIYPAGKFIPSQLQNDRHSAPRPRIATLVFLVISTAKNHPNISL